MRTVRVVAISCTHAPFTPPETTKWLCDSLSKIKGIDWFVHLGDLFEAAAASVHASSEEYSHTLEDEFEFGHNLLRSIRLVLPRKAKLICHLGNHDDNILTQDEYPLNCGLLWIGGSTISMARSSKSGIGSHTKKQKTG